MKLARIVLALGLIVAAIPAQFVPTPIPGYAQWLGGGFPGSSGVTPGLNASSAAGLIRSGQLFTVDLDGAPPRSGGWLIAGRQFVGTPLLNGRQIPSMDAMLSLRTDQNGRWGIPVNAWDPIAGSLYAQVAVLDPASWHGFALSDGVMVTPAAAPAVPTFQGASQLLAWPNALAPGSSISVGHVVDPSAPWSLLDDVRPGPVNLEPVSDESYFRLSSATQARTHFAQRLFELDASFGLFGSAEAKAASSAKTVSASNNVVLRIARRTTYRETGAPFTQSELRAAALANPSTSLESGWVVTGATYAVEVVIDFQLSSSQLQTIRSSLVSVNLDTPWVDISGSSFSSLSSALSSMGVTGSAYVLGSTLGAQTIQITAGSSFEDLLSQAAINLSFDPRSPSLNPLPYQIEFQAFGTNREPTAYQTAASSLRREMRRLSTIETWLEQNRLGHLDRGLLAQLDSAVRAQRQLMRTGFEQLGANAWIAAVRAGDQALAASLNMGLKIEVVGSGFIRFAGPTPYGSRTISFQSADWQLGTAGWARSFPIQSQAVTREGPEWTGYLQDPRVISETIIPWTQAGSGAGGLDLSLQLSGEMGMGGGASPTRMQFHSMNRHMGPNGTNTSVLWPPSISDLSPNTWGWLEIYENLPNGAPAAYGDAIGLIEVRATPVAITELMWDDLMNGR